MPQGLGIARGHYRPPSQVRSPGVVAVGTERFTQPGWLLASLGGLAAALALIAGLAMLATQRAGRRVRAGHAA